jgi:hypothetical protein
MKGKRTPTRNWICHTIVDETVKQKRRKYRKKEKLIFKPTVIQDF